MHQLRVIRAPTECWQGLGSPGVWRVTSLLGLKAAGTNSPSGLLNLVPETSHFRCQAAPVPTRTPLCYGEAEAASRHLRLTGGSRPR